MNHPKISVVWLRRDLRLEDHHALSRACAGDSQVMLLFIFDKNILTDLDPNDQRVSLIYKQLQKLNQVAETMNSRIVIRHGDPIAIFRKLCQQYSVETMYYNRDYEPYARKRDHLVETLLKNQGIEVFSFADQVIFEPQEILKSSGDPYTIFTPYKRKWLEKFQAERVEPHSVQLSKKILSTVHLQHEVFPTLPTMGFQPHSVSLAPYSISHLENYAQERDIPALDSTSGLSPYLRFGMVSIRQVIRSLSASDDVFLGELIWREFFMQILYHFPHVQHGNFNAKYNAVPWRHHRGDFEKWCAGHTGYPLVDAGMRQLNATGLMHNRVRMITASFLCKHLLIDWKWGEQYFAQKLLDYDLSANNGNWQWSAGTGCDAAPYFRIFNPITQLKKFDPDHEYVKKWIPELDTASYAKPMVHHAVARNRCLTAYQVGIQRELKD